jgi:hypothetical protein
LSYGKTINEFKFPNSSRAHYNHALETTFSKNLLNVPSLNNLEDDFIEEKIAKH